VKCKSWNNKEEGAYLTNQKQNLQCQISATMDMLLHLNHFHISSLFSNSICKASVPSTMPKLYLSSSFASNYTHNQLLASVNVQ